MPIVNVVIMYGIIKDEAQDAIANAIVQMIEIDPKNDNTRRNLGYTTTDINGYYTFSVLISNDKIYQLSIYPPLNK
ncbi:MAG: hypothetical protein ACRC92_06660 [Peptostreptococcaceae bacterium]